MKVVIWTTILSALCSTATGAYLSTTSVENLSNYCKSVATEYNTNIEKLSGDNIHDNEEGDKERVKIKNEILKFCTKDCAVESDLPISQKILDMPGYLGNIDAMEIKSDISFSHEIEMSEVYVDKEGHYFLVAHMDRTIRTKSKDDQNIKGRDIYFSLTPGEYPKIYKICNHKEYNYLRATIESDKISSEGDDKKPFFLFNVTPAVSMIKVDGKNILIENLRLNTVEGNHTLEISSDGYYTEKFDVNVNHSGAFVVDLQLKKKIGYLAVTSDDPASMAAEVNIDDTDVGTIPLKSYRLEVGRHIVIVKGDNYNKRIYVTISEEDVTYLNIQKKHSHPFNWLNVSASYFSENYRSLYVPYPPIARYPSNYFNQNTGKSRRFFDGVKKFSGSYFTNPRVPNSQPIPENQKQNGNSQRQRVEGHQRFVRPFSSKPNPSTTNRRSSTPHIIRQQTNRKK